MSNRRKIDLDAARRAQAELEQQDDPPVVILGGKTFELPAKLPAKVIVALAQVRRKNVEFFVDVFDGLFGENADEVLALGLELDELDTIIDGAYGDGEDAEEAVRAPE